MFSPTQSVNQIINQYDHPTLLGPTTEHLTHVPLLRSFLEALPYSKYEKEYFTTDSHLSNSLRKINRSTSFGTNVKWLIYSRFESPYQATWVVQYATLKRKQAWRVVMTAQLSHPIIIEINQIRHVDLPYLRTLINTGRTGYTHRSASQGLSCLTHAR